MRSQQQAWYIDNRFYFTKEFTDEFIKNAVEIINSGSEVIGANLKHYYPNDGNVSSRITAAHNFGLLDGKSRLSDSSILYNSGCISYSDLLIELMFKRNAFKESVIKIKPFVLLCILFHKMNTIHIPEEERFITAAECYEYLTPIEKYEELTDSLVNKIVSERQYAPNKKIPVTRVKNIKNGVYLSSIFTALKDSGICSFGLQKSIIHPSPICYDFYEYISTKVNDISGYDAIEGDALYDYLCDIRKGLYEVVPHLSLKKTLKPSDTQGFYEYIFGINARSSFRPFDYFDKECYGIYRPLFCAKGVILAYIYLLDSRTGELLFDFNNQAVYERILKDGKIMIKTPFLTTEHTGIKELIKDEDSTFLTPDWFKAHADEFEDIALEAEIQYDDFQEKFAPDILSALSGEELLRKMFYSGDSNKENLCYYLEFHIKNRELFGSVAGGSAFKFNLFYQKKNSSWMTGSATKPQKLTLDEAIVLGTEIRDAIVSGAEIIKENKGASTVEGYYELYNKLFAVMGKYINLLWVQKYYHIIFPDMFPVFYNEAWQRFLLTKLDIEPYDSGFVRMGQINLFVKECEIPNVVFAQIIYKYCNMADDDKVSSKDEPEEVVETELPALEPRTGKIMPLNFILYGAPGTGKTYATAEYAMAIVEGRKVDLSQKTPEERSALMEKYKAAIKEGRITFTTFHQSYGYEDFIQGLRPDTKQGGLNFVPVDGVFKRIVNEAIRNGDKDYVIIIDEINRANISKVFGELITLIESDKRWGEINALSVTLPSGESFAVPNNLFIVGTMNSADKSISLIDAALRRRFDFIEVVPNSAIVENEVLRTILDRLNDHLFKELDSTDLLVGHAYFMGKTEDDLCDIINHSIVPLLYEYFYDNSNKVKNILEKAIEGYNFQVTPAKVGRLKLTVKG